MGKKIYYAGIGSRNTPVEFTNSFTNVSKYLAENNFVLRSGHADGADMAFEIGCDMAKGEKEIYIPWANFNNSKSSLIVKDIEAFKIAEKYHPYWNNLKDGAKKLQARNSHQILGQDLKTKSDFVLCYTKNGSGEGGTGQAIRIASSLHIPIIDAGNYSTGKEFEHAVWIFLLEKYHNK